MTEYLITYDLNRPGQQHQNIDDLLSKQGAIRVLESVWILKTSKRALAVLKEVERFLDSGDKAIVAELGAGVAWTSNLTPVMKKIYPVFTES